MNNTVAFTSYKVATMPLLCGGRSASCPVYGRMSRTILLTKLSTALVVIVFNSLGPIPVNSVLKPSVFFKCHAARLRQ